MLGLTSAVGQQRGNPQGTNQVLWKTRDENGNWKAADPNEELRLDVYHPPYLFRGERPVIEDTESEITYGQQFTIRSTAADRIWWVSLIRPGVITRSFDSSQRLMNVEITAVVNGRLDVTVPTNPNAAPPGGTCCSSPTGKRSLPWRAGCT